MSDFIPLKIEGNYVQGIFFAWVLLVLIAFFYCYASSWVFMSGDQGFLPKFAWVASRWGAWPLLLPISLQLYAGLCRKFGNPRMSALLTFAALLITVPVLGNILNSLLGFPEPLLVSYYNFSPVTIGTIVYFLIASRILTSWYQLYPSASSAGIFGSTHSYRPDVSLESANEKFLKKLLETIDQNIGKRGFSVGSLADAMAMSRRQLHRKTVAKLKITPSEAIRRRRLETAKQLLELDADTVSQVAYAVGFDSPANFSRRFKEMFGVLPSKLKKNQAKES